MSAFAKEGVRDAPFREIGRFETLADALISVSYPLGITVIKIVTSNTALSPCGGP